MIPRIAETEVARIWREQLLSAGALFTEEGEALEVIEPGYSNDDRGPDFKEAVLRLGGRLVRGDVEVHVHSRGWWEHGHHRDPVYDGVVLHVVMWDDAGASAALSCGGRASIFVVPKYARVPVSGWQSGESAASNALGCRRAWDPENDPELAGIVDQAGDERFLGKAAVFEAGIARGEAAQCLYEGVMGALGYARNKQTFLELARRVPIGILENAVADRRVQPEALPVLVKTLLGESGLMDSPGQSECVGAVLGNTGAALSACRETSGMSLRDWRLLKVRPNNSPALRLIGMSYLLVRYGPSGLLEGLLGLVEGVKVGRDGCRFIEAGLASGCGKLTLVGRSRAADIAVNVLLPFSYAWSRCAAEPALGEKAIGLYRVYPRLAGNSVEEQMESRLGLSRRVIDSARRQQGLIHIYKSFCGRAACGTCRLRQAQAGDDVQIEPVGLAGA